MEQQEETQLKTLESIYQDCLKAEEEAKHQEFLNRQVIFEHKNKICEYDEEELKESKRKTDEKNINVDKTMTKLIDYLYKLCKELGETIYNMKMSGYSIFDDRHIYDHTLKSFRLVEDKWTWLIEQLMKYEDKIPDLKGMDFYIEEYKKLKLLVNAYFNQVRRSFRSLKDDLQNKWSINRNGYLDDWQTGKKITAGKAKKQDIKKYVENVMEHRQYHELFFNTESEKNKFIDETTNLINEMFKKYFINKEVNKYYEEHREEILKKFPYVDEEKIWVENMYGNKLLLTEPIKADCGCIYNLNDAKDRSSICSSCGKCERCENYVRVNDWTIIKELKKIVDEIVNHILTKLDHIEYINEEDTEDPETTQSLPDSESDIEAEEETEDEFGIDLSQIGFGIDPSQIEFVETPLGMVIPVVNKLRS
jgi:hypothetical protein